MAELQDGRIAGWQDCKSGNQILQLNPAILPFCHPAILRIPTAVSFPTSKIR
jgi:hypothetical protein